MLKNLRNVSKKGLGLFLALSMAIPAGIMPQAPAFFAAPGDYDYAYSESLAARPAEADADPFLRTYHNAPSSTAQMGGDNFANSGATPIGNGYMGATLYGGILDDTMLINEKTIWSGGPESNNDFSQQGGTYNGGIIPGKHDASKASLEKVRNLVDQAVNDFAPGSPTEQYPMILRTAGENSGRGEVAQEVHANLYGNKNGFGAYQELSKLHLKDIFAAYPARIPAATGIDSNSAGNAAENVSNIFTDDNNKWYTGTTPSAENPIYVKWGYANALSFTEYVVATANDSENRDPAAWTLYGSNSDEATGASDANWTVLHEVTGETMPNGRNTKRTYTIPGGMSESYKYFKVVFTAVKGPQNGGFQISRFIPTVAASGPSLPVVTNERDLYDENTYRRELNLETGVTTITYDYTPEDKPVAHITKEYFMNYPNNVFVMKVSSDQPISQRLVLDTVQRASTITVDAENDIIQLEGQPSDNKVTGLHFLQQVKVVTLDGGSVEATDEEALVERGLTIKDSKEFIIIMTAGTNYKVDLTNQYDFFNDREEALEKVRERLDAALALGYNQLLKNHLDDYQALFDRVDFKLDGVTVPDVPTTTLVGSGGSNYTNASANNKRYIEMLYYQFGRYLLIASSREGSLPANLQGVWAAQNPPWEADYHTNVNLQMNYWPAEVANLAETHLPMLEYVAMNAPRGHEVADQYHHTPNTDDGYNNKGGVDNRGWTSYHLNNIWGHSGPESYWQGAYAPAGGTWTALDIWTNYAFTRDKETLEKYYDVLMDAAIFWVDNLWTDTATGKLVANASYSPEHGPYTFATTFEQGVIWEIFQNAQDAYKVVGPKTGAYNEYDDAFVAEIAEAQANLLLPDVNGVPHEKGFRRTGIGSDGQFMEWPYESIQDVRGTDADNGTGGKHRHTNHLFMLHPGSLIVPGRSASEDVFAEAMKRTLEVRTDAGTGWSRAWKVNFWARLRDGDRALQVYAGLLNDSTLPQLFDTHAPFQIDGNFGGTAGVQEMLLQSQAGYIELLPALPAAWNNGHIYGLKARGNVEVDQDWANGKLTKAVLKANSDGAVTVKYEDISSAAITNKAGQAVAATIDGSNTITINAAAGEEYTITPGGAVATNTTTFTVLPEDAADVAITVKGVNGTVFAETAVAAGDAIELPDGDYEYTVSASNYVVSDIVEPTFFLENGDKIVDIALEATDFEMVINVTPADAAEEAVITVYNGDAVVEPKADGVYQLANGEYDYTVTSDGYADASGTFVVAGRGRTVSVPMNFMYDVTFDIEPADAATNAVVTVDGQTAASPNAFKLVNGTYAYTVESAAATDLADRGYIKRTGTFTVNNANLVVDVPTMIPFEGQYDITFNVTPNAASLGALISVQNIETGEVKFTDTAERVLPIAPGTYGYTVTAPGYATKYAVLEVTNGEMTVNVQMALNPTGSIRLIGLTDDISNNNERQMEEEGGRWVGWIRPTAWINYANTNIAGGIGSYAIKLARDGNATGAIDVRISAPGAGFAAATSIGGYSAQINTGGWGELGSIEWIVEGDDIIDHLGGIVDLYVVFLEGEINYGGITLNLKQVSSEKQNYNATFNVSPADAEVTVTDLSGNVIEPNAAGGKAYTMLEGFYKYTVSADGFESQSGVLALDMAKSISVELLVDEAEYDVTFAVTPALAADGTQITIQDIATGEALYSDSTEKVFALENGEYGYSVMHANYITKMGIIEVAGAEMTVDVEMTARPAGSLSLRGLTDETYNSGPNGEQMAEEADRWVGWVRPLAWIKYADTNIAGGIESFTATFARGGEDEESGTTTGGFELRIAAPGAPFESALTIGSRTKDIFTNGWGAPGEVWNFTGDQIAEHNGGTYDVYAVFTAGEINYGGLELTLKPMAPEKQTYNLTFNTSPASANITVTDLAGNAVEPNLAGGRVYTMLEGFYRYAVSAEGFSSASGLVTLDTSKSVAVDLIPDEVVEYNVFFNVTPSTAVADAKVTIQDLVTGDIVIENSTSKYLELVPGKYGYTVANPEYITKMGIVDVLDDNKMTVDVPMISTPDGNVHLYGINGGYMNTGNNGVLNQESTYWTGMIRPLTWIKYPNTNIAGGILDFTVTLARQGNSTGGFELRIANPGAPFEEAVTIGGRTATINTGGWGAPGVEWTVTDIAEHLGGTYDVYAVITAGEINYGGVRLTLAPMPTTKQNFNVTFSTRPSDATIELTTIDGDVIDPIVPGGNVYNTLEGFYKYTVSADGYISASDILTLDTSKSVSVALIPTAGSFNQTLEAEDGVITDGAVIEGDFSNGEAVEFTTSANVGAINGTFSNISNVRFSVPRNDTGVVPVNIYYDSTVAAAGQAYIAVKSGSGAIKQVALNPEGVSTVFVDMLGLDDNVLYVSNIVNPTNGHEFILDRIAVHSETLLGSVEIGQDDVPFIQPNNPIVKSIFTADSEAHVWPDEPEKMYIYPSHDVYPAAGCDRMDAYHVYSTTDMVTFVDEGEILRYQDIADAKNAPGSTLWQDFVPSQIDANGNRKTYMWAPDIAYTENDGGWYYFYWPVIMNADAGMDQWVTGVVRSRYPNKGFEMIPEEDAYPGWKGYLEGMPSRIDISVRVYDGETYVCVGGSQTYHQGKLKDNMVELEEPYKTNGLIQVTDSNGNQDDAYDPIDNPDSIKHKLPHFHEGPSHFKRVNDLGETWYYLIYPGGFDQDDYMDYAGREGGDGYHYAMSQDPFGIDPENPMKDTWVYKGTFFDPAGWNTIHGSVAEFQGNTYVTYHGADISGDGALRSIGIEEIKFNPDGTIIHTKETLDGPGKIPGVDLYVRPEGTVYSVENDGLEISGQHTLYKDSNATHGSEVIADMNGNTTITLNGVDGGEGQRAMLVINFATTSNVPKLRLNVNGMDYSYVNMLRTGGRSFFGEAEFTVKALNPGTDNTIVLSGLTNANNGLVINSVEVILFDEEGIDVPDPVNDISIDERVIIAADETSLPSDGAFNPNFDVEAVEDITLTLIVASYDADGKLAYVSIDDAALEAGETDNLKAAVDTEAGYTYKFFIWDSEFKPLTAINTIDALEL